MASALASQAISQARPDQAKTSQLEISDALSPYRCAKSLASDKLVQFNDFINRIANCLPATEARRRHLSKFGYNWQRNQMLDLSN